MKTGTFTNEHGEEFLVIRANYGYYLFGSETEYEALPLILGDFELSDNETAALQACIRDMDKQ